jgi:hypothetical protein
MAKTNIIPVSEAACRQILQSDEHPTHSIAIFSGAPLLYLSLAVLTMKFLEVRDWIVDAARIAEDAVRKEKMVVDLHKRRREYLEIIDNLSKHIASSNVKEACMAWREVYEFSRSDIFVTAFTRRGDLISLPLLECKSSGVRELARQFEKIRSVLNEAARTLSKLDPNLEKDPKKSSWPPSRSQPEIDVMWTEIVARVNADPPGFNDWPLDRRKAFVPHGRTVRCPDEARPSEEAVHASTLMFDAPHKVLKGMREWVERKMAEEKLAPHNADRWATTFARIMLILWHRWTGDERNPRTKDCQSFLREVYACIAPKATLQEEIARLTAAGAKPEQIAQARVDFQTFAKIKTGACEEEYLAAFRNVRLFAPPKEVLERSSLGAIYLAKARDLNLMISDDTVRTVVKCDLKTMKNYRHTTKENRIKTPDERHAEFLDNCLDEQLKNDPWREASDAAFTREINRPWVLQFDRFRNGKNGLAARAAPSEEAAETSETWHARMIEALSLCDESVLPKREGESWLAMAVNSGARADKDKIERDIMSALNRAHLRVTTR